LLNVVVKCSCKMGCTRKTPL